MKKLIYLLIILFSLPLFAQEVATQELRSEIHETYKDGSKKREYFYKGDEFIKVINYDIEGVTSSIFHLTNGKKKEYIKYIDYQNKIIEQHKFFHPNEKTAIDIYFNNKGLPETVYFKLKNGKDKYKVYWEQGTMIDSIKHYLSGKQIYNSKGNKIKGIGYHNTGKLSSIGHYYYGKPHGWTIRYSEDGSIISKSFSSKGIREGQYGTKSYKKWEQEIPEFDSIPKLEKELDHELKRLGLLKQ